MRPRFNLADRTVAESKISAVTAYTDRAMVTRIASVKIDKGDQEIRFAELPTSADKNSVQVSGRGKAVIRDVRFGQEQLAGLTDQQVQKLMDRRDSLADSIRVSDDRIAAAQSQKNFLENITKKVTSADTQEKNAGPELDVTKWSAMVAFYRKSLGTLDEEIRGIDNYKKDLDKRIDKLNREIADRGGLHNRTKPFVDVMVEGKEAGFVTLELSYVVHGVHWQPSYTIRVASEARKMHLIYNARVRQTTGEDWAGVSLSLSTAAPAAGGEVPALAPWYVDVYAPRQYRAIRKESFNDMELKSKAPYKNFDIPEGAPSPEPMPVGSAAPQPSMASENSEIDNGLASAVYAVPGKRDIASDNQDHQVSIASFDLPIELSYAAVPKLRPAVFLKAAATDSSEYTLLPGQTAVFLDNSFACNGSMELVAPGQKFEVSLGADEQIHIERKLINRFQKEEGVITKWSKVIFTYSIVIKNNKKSDERISLKDQLPVSKNQDVVIAYVPPDRSPAFAPIIDKTGIVEWNVTVRAGQEVAIPLSFSVTFPRGVNVEGLGL